MPMVRESHTQVEITLPVSVSVSLKSLSINQIYRFLNLCQGNYAAANEVPTLDAKPMLLPFAMREDTVL
jgi:hypothetical protein